jgi:hypothetical protein
MTDEDNTVVLPQGDDGDCGKGEGKKGRAAFENQKDEQRQGNQGGDPAFPVHVRSVYWVSARSAILP